jgi:hypothetical protein
MKPSIFISGVAVLLLAPSPGAAQQRQLTLSLESAKAEYALGEPLYLTARLRNAASTAVKLPKQLNPKYGNLSVQVLGPGGRRIGFFPLSALDDDAPPEDLAPGAELSEVFSVFFGSQGWTFSQPGEYQVRAAYRSPVQGQGEPVYSNSLKLTVTTGDGSGDFLVNSGEASRQAGKFLVWQSGDHLRKGIAHLESLLERFPESVLADYVRLAFGRNLSQPFQDYSAGRVRPPNCPAALEHLRRVRDAQLPPYLRIHKNLSHASCLVRLNEKRAARALLAETRKAIDSNTAFRPLLERFARIERAAAETPQR